MSKIFVLEATVTTSDYSEVTQAAIDELQTILDSGLADSVQRMIAERLAKAMVLAERKDTRLLAGRILQGFSFEVETMKF